jgi:predicted GNAT superfamily acetyltransferase
VLADAASFLPLMPQPLDYRIEFLKDIAPLRQCMEIQKLAWGFTDADILPLRTLVVCTKIGGQVFGALDNSGTVLGFLNAFPGYRDGLVYLHSQMMGVRPEYQNQGIGKQLKLAQREEALHRGIGRIEWTFDPLEVWNARFNIELLGAVCRRYLVDTYGASSSHLHSGFPTDRLVAEWYLNSSRVKSKLQTEPLTNLSPQQVSVEIPLNIRDLKSTAPDTALKIQLSVRKRMLELFSSNYYLSRFEIKPTTQKAAYVFEPLDESGLFL